MTLRSCYAFLAVVSAAPAGAAPAGDPAGGPGAAAARQISSRRTSDPPHIDGDLSDPAWQAAVPTDSLTQATPDPGKPAPFPTEIRVLHSDDAVFVAMRCYDPEPDKIEARVSRRDRYIESDWVQVDFDSRHDRRSAFWFAMNAAGVKQDGTVVDENRENTDWDGVWEGAAHIDDKGWVAEMRIPLSLLRFTAGPDVQMGVQFWRRSSRKNDWSQWQFIPPESGRRVSRYGVLTGLDLQKQPQRIEIAPYVAGRLNAPGGITPGLEPFLPGAGVDGKLGLGSSFTLTLTGNPDFGQVEVDRVVLNLSTIETFFPEKRTFFLEDAALFQTPRWGDAPRPDLFYTRRIGRAPRTPSADTDAGETLVRAARIPTIYGAAKLAGRTEGRLSLGVLEAVTSPEDATYRGADGVVFHRLAEPLTSFSILRAQQDFWDHSSVGFMGTATASPNDGAALTGSGDLQMELLGGEYKLTALSFFSHLTPERIPWHDKFTRAGIARDGPNGHGWDLIISKESGETWVAAAGALFRSPALALNDLGFLQRPDFASAWAWGQIRRLKPLGILDKYRVSAVVYSDNNTRGLNLANGFNANFWTAFTNAYEVSGWFWLDSPRCDDRETRSAGAVVACLAEPMFGGGMWGQTDPRAPINAQGQVWVDRAPLGLAWGADATLNVIPHPRVQIELRPAYISQHGQLRWIDTDGDRYLFAVRGNEIWDFTLRGSVTLLTTLTVQLYGQAFLVAVDNAQKLAATPRSGRIEQAALAAAPDVPDDYDFSSASLNLGAVVRWEYAPGSVAYLVYTGAFAHELGVADFRFGKLFGDLFGKPADHAVMLKVSYFWG